MDEAHSNREFKEVYQYTFREYLDRWTPLDSEDQPPPLNQDPELDEYRLGKLETLRFSIKKDRDKWFVENRYDDLDVSGVPKSFWLNNYEQTVDQEDIDEYAQSALEEWDQDTGTQT